MVWIIQKWKEIFFISLYPSTPTLSLHQWEISQLVFNLFLLCQFFLGEGSPILGVPTSKFGDGSLILGALGEGSPILGVLTPKFGDGSLILGAPTPNTRGTNQPKKFLCTKMLFRHHISNKKKIFFPTFWRGGGGLNPSGKIPTFFLFYFWTLSLHYISYISQFCPKLNLITDHIPVLGLDIVERPV